MKDRYEKHRKNCYVSYPFDKDIDIFFKQVVFPILTKNYYSPTTLTDSGEYQQIYEFVFNGIRKCDLFICDLSRNNPNVIYELGLANAWGKPVIVFVNSESNEKFHNTSFGHNLIILYNRIEQDFQFFDRLLGRFRYSLVDTTLSNFHKIEELLIVQSEDKGNPEIALNFIAEITKTIKDIINEDEIELIDLQKGSSKGIFDIDFRAIAELAEKIIFFIPTWRDKKAETNRKVIESKKLQAEIDKIKAETNKINSETEINEAKAVLEIIEKYQELGVRKLQFGDRLIITADERNNYFLAIPERLGSKLENINKNE